MPIRLQNYQHLRTNALGTFTGATSFSWSLRLLIDSMAYTGDALVLGGQFFGMFSLRFTAVSGSNVTLRAGVTRSGSSLSTSTFQVPMGRPVHLACTYSGTDLLVYLNGTLAAWSSAGASLAISEDRPIFLGVASTFAGFTADYTVDDFRLWRNVVLSLAQIQAFRDGLPFPAGLDDPFLAWSLAGDADQNVLLASQGVQSAGASAAFVSTPPPVFADRDMAYVPTVRVLSAAVAPSRKGILIRLEDILNGAPVPPSTLGASPTLTVDGSPADLDAIGPIWQANALPYIYYPLAAPIDPAAEVRLSAPTGWAQAGSRGEVQGMAGLAVTNPGPAILPDLPTGPKQMALGWNVPNAPNYGQVRTYANLVRQMSTGFAPQVGDSSPAVTYDPVTGFPSNVTGGEVYGTLVQSATAVFDPRGYATIPAGAYVLLWDGTGNVRLEERSNVHGFAQVSADLTGPTDKRRTYTLTLNPAGTGQRSAVIRLILGGQISNVRVYGPGTPTDGSEKFHPGYLRMIAGSRLIRFMDATVTNNSPRVTMADFPSRDRFTFDVSSTHKTIARTIASVGPHDNSDGYFLANGRCHVLVTTTAPHGIATGQFVYFSNLGGGVDGDGRLVLNNGTRVNITTIATQSVPAICRVLSPTTLAISLYTGVNGAPGQPAGIQAITGQALVRILNAVPFEDCVEIANRVGADPWICVPHAFTDEAVAELAASLVSVLDPGRKLRVEYTNEHWNIAIAFQQADYCAGQGAISSPSLTATQWYAKRAGEIHAIFAAAFASAGRPGDLIRVFGSQSANPGITSQIVAYCGANGIPVDEIAIAPYFYNAPSGNPTRWAALDPDQLHDLSDLAILRFTGKVAAHRPILQSSFPSARVVCYEGGMEMGVPIQGYGANSVAVAALSRAWVRHPRVRRTVLQYCQNLENEGCHAFAYFALAGPMPDYSGLQGGATWLVYNRTDQPSGLGDGSDGQFDNRTDYQDMGRVVAVVPKGIEEWIAMMEPGAAPGSPAPHLHPFRVGVLGPGMSLGARVLGHPGRDWRY